MPAPDTGFRAEARIAARHETMRLLADGWTAATIAHIGDSYVLGLGELVDLALRQAAQARGRIACKAACAFCCYQTVVVTEPEVFLLVRHLETSLAPEALTRTKERVAAAWERAKGLTPTQRLKARIPCPLLDLKQRTCTVYALRPLSCRSFHSTSRTACETGARKPGSNKTIPGYGLPHEVVFGLREGLADAFSAHGRTSADLDLIGALASVWSRPAAIEGWLAGETIFTGATAIVSG